MSADDEASLAEDFWISFSEMDLSKYSSSVTAFGIFTSTITHPFNVVMTRQQASPEIMGNSTKRGFTVFSNMYHLIRKSGIRSIFRGWLPIASVGVPSTLVYLSIVESTRERFQHALKKILPGCSSFAIDGIQSLMTSVIANGVSLLVWVPAEVISSKMIVQTETNLGMTAMTRRVWRQDGIPGYFRGYNVSLFYGVLAGSQWWWAYSVSRRELSGFKDFAESPVLLDATSGFIAGMYSTIVGHPIDTLKTRIMTNEGKFRSIYGSLKNIVVQEGWRALFRGLPASVYQSGLSSTGFALGYEIVKRFSAS
jgi:Mitochondrial carrier protein